MSHIRKYRTKTEHWVRVAVVPHFMLLIECFTAHTHVYVFWCPALRLEICHRSSHILYLLPCWAIDR